MPLTEPIEEVIHGVTVRDPYRWLETRALPETDEWIREQQRRCDDYFSACPELAWLERRVEAYLDVEVVDQPTRISDRYFYRKRRKGEEQAGLYAREKTSKIERLLVDPSTEGRYASVGIYRISPDGAYLAFEHKHGGEDRKQIRFADVEGGEILPDSVPAGYGRGLVFAVNGYFYSQEIEESIDEHLVHYHVFGSMKTDAVVFRAPRVPGSRVVLTGNAQRMGVLWLRPDVKEVIADFAIADLVETPKWTNVFREKRMPYNPWLCHDRIFVLTETESKRSRLIELSTDGKELRALIPEKAIPIRHLLIAGDRIFVSYQERGLTTIDAWQFDGRQVDSVILPADGTVEMLPPHVQGIDSFFYSHQSFDQPPALYEYFVHSQKSMRWHQRKPKIPPNTCHVREEEVTSSDGTGVPLTLVSRNRSSISSPGPVIMTSYGGFGLSMTPQFSALVAIMMDLGVTFALPHIRGGGDFGKEWHDAGHGRHRQVSFSDFIAAAEWLCQQGVTIPEKLAIFGGSNSGLLVGAAMTQRPDLFRAVVCIAPLLDMVRYEVFDQAVNWQHEYGTVHDPEDFQALVAYSPYHRIADHMNYPATLFVTGDKDDRCNPAHTRKMAALLQQRPAQTSPVILDYSAERGHSPVLPLSVRIPALARRIAFLCRELHVAIPHGDFDEAPRA
jgi:prolyl oligopeptidase